MDSFSTRETFLIKNPVFEFDGDDLLIDVNYECGDFSFTEKFHYIFGPFVHNYSELELERAIKLVSLAAAPSYYKAMLARSIECEFELSLEQVEFLSGLLGPGLAEFRFQNNIDLRSLPELKKIRKIKFESNQEPRSSNFAIVPIGGGKDSVTTLEIMKRSGLEIIGFSVGNFEAIEKTAKAAEVDLVHVDRNIDQKLLELNSQGFPNGHVPVTALTSALAVVAGVVLNASKVVMSNESSADEPTRVVDGYEVNHQWSKSKSAEDLIYEAIMSSQIDIEYFSALRNLSEFEIFSLFSSFDKYHKVITSCNKVFKINEQKRMSSWCGDCDKCRFVFLGLAAFNGQMNASEIIGANLFDDESQTGGFRDLLGIQDNKPFECVGTVRESRILFRKCMKDPNVANSVVGKKLESIFSSFNELDEKLMKPLFIRNTSFEVDEIIINLQIEQYKNRLKASIRNMSIGIMGIGRDTGSIIRFLSTNGDSNKFKVYLPNNIDIEENELEDLLRANDLFDFVDQIELVDDVEKLNSDIVFVSPGISKYSDEVVALGEKATTPLAWWLEYNKIYFPDKCFIGVTGTKGKSTTASLLGHVLPNAIVAGNLGFAVGNVSLNSLFVSDFIVLEVSSFQASYVTTSPDIVAVTSLFDCHIDWHRTPENYRHDKLNIALHGCSEVVVSDTISDFAPFLAEIRRVQGQNNRTDVISLVPSIGRSLLQRNQEVVRAVVGIVCPRLEQNDVDELFDSFAELKHRQEIISQKNGVYFVSDVLSTAPGAVLTAVDDFVLRYPKAKIYLLLGGADRNVDQSELIFGLNARKEKVMSICLPETGHMVEELLESKVHCDELTDGVVFASKNAKAGDVVLLAPGAPSFHRYSNYEQLASHFEELVNNLA